MLFADTSALFAFLVADDVHHRDAVLAQAQAVGDGGLFVVATLRFRYATGSPTTPLAQLR